MRKNLNLLAVIVWLVVILFTCALLMNGIADWQQIVLLVCAAVTGWVYMACESIAMRAHNLLQLAEMAVHEKTKPPEGVNDIT